MTITVSEEVARWARRKAADEDTSVSRLVGQMLEEEMRRADKYRRAVEKLRKIKPIPGFDASKRASREELCDRGPRSLVRRQQRPAV